MADRFIRIRPGRLEDEPLRKAVEQIQGELRGLEFSIPQGVSLRGGNIVHCLGFEANLAERTSDKKQGFGVVTEVQGTRCWVRSDGTHPVLVDTDEWDSTQEWSIYVGDGGVGRIASSTEENPSTPTGAYQNVIQFARPVRRMPELGTNVVMATIIPGYVTRKIII